MVAVYTTTRRTTEPEVSKRNLVFTTAGPGVCNTSQYVSPTASYDLAVFDYGDEDTFDPGDAQYYARVKGPKYDTMHRLLAGWSLTDKYDFYFFPDQDIEIPAAKVDELFRLASLHDLSLCQPALDHRSTISWGVTRQQEDCLFRYTNFVEVMAPLFDRRAFDACYPTFTRSLSSWGLDLFWGKIVTKLRLNIGVIDCVTMGHPHERGSETWRMSNGKTARQELDELVEAEKLSLTALTMKRIRASEFPTPPLRIF